MTKVFATGTDEKAAAAMRPAIPVRAEDAKSTSVSPLALHQPKSVSMGGMLVRELVGNWLVAASTVFLVFIVAVAVFAPFLTSFTPDFQNLKERLDPPSWKHLMGTDDIGRDTFARLLYGARYSLFIAVTGTLGAVAFGTLLGLISGYFGGWIDEVSMRIVDVTFAFPGVLFAILIVSVLGPGLWNLIIALIFFGAPTLSRIVRGNVLSLKQQDFVEASRSMGASPSRILFRHILTNCVAPIIVYATLGIAISILIASGLGFLGLGAQPPTPEWGLMLSDARKQMRLSPYMSIFPGTAIFLTVLALNIIGDAARDALDPYTAKRKVMRQGGA
jgi:ABC-type dipeptide/oligopeptide/nickel transport system permease subunit